MGINEELLFNGCKVPVWGDKKLWRQMMMVAGNLAGVLNTIEVYTEKKNVKMVNFTLDILYNHLEES